MTVDLLRRRGVVIAALLVLSLVVTGFVWAQKKVDVVVDGKNLAIRTLYSKPADVLKQAGVTMDSRDEYRMSTDRMTSGTVITVYRAVPVTVSYQGKTETVVMGKPTVGEVAIALGITNSNVKLIPGADTAVTANMQIKAVIVTQQVVDQEIPIAHPVIRQPDNTMEKGEEHVAEYGEDGRKTAKVTLTYEDGIQTTSEILTETVIQEPKAKIIRVGTRDTVDTSRGTMRFRRTEWMEASAYLPNDGGGNGVTATGIMARHGIVAVDPSFIPLGSRLYIPGYGLALAADTGGAIRGDKIDLCMEDSSDAWRFGRQTIKVYVLE